MTKWLDWLVQDVSDVIILGYRLWSNANRISRKLILLLILSRKISSRSNLLLEIWCHLQIKVKMHCAWSLGLCLLNHMMSVTMKWSPSPSLLDTYLVHFFVQWECYLERKCVMHALCTKRKVFSFNSRGTSNIHV